MELPSTWPTPYTARSSELARVLDDYFSARLQQHPLDYFPLKDVGNRCKEDPRVVPKLSKPQSIVHALAKGMAQHPESPQRGLLVWHSTGSGKTCTAMGIMEAYWDAQPEKPLVFVTSVEAKASLPPSTFARCAWMYFPRFQAMTAHVSDPQAKTDIVLAAMEKRKVQFYTFAVMAHVLGLPQRYANTKGDSFLENAVVIIDEVHNIFKPLPHQVAEHNALAAFLQDHASARTRNMHTYILTATPGDTPDEVVRLLNMIRPHAAPSIPVPATGYTDNQWRVFGEAVRGLVSYFNGSGDYSRYPHVIMEDPHVVPMTMRQYEDYLQAASALHQGEDDAAVEVIDKKTRKLRRYANTLFNYDKSAMSLYDFSVKIPRLLESFRKYGREKHYVYSSFYDKHGFGGHGIIAIAKLMEEPASDHGMGGYTKLTVEEALRHYRAKTLPTPGKRYLILTTTEWGQEASDAREKPPLRALIYIFNHPANAHGELVHVMLASQKFNESIDLKGVRHIHIFEPLLSANKELQTVGRAARSCSHKDLRTWEWTVHVHRYLTDYPLELDVIINSSIQEDKSYIGYFTQLLTNKSKDLQRKWEARQKEVDAYEKRVAILREAKAKVPMIDFVVMRQAKAAFDTMLRIHTIMKERAIDCRLLREIHESEGVTCTS